MTRRWLTVCQWLIVAAMFAAAALAWPRAPDSFALPLVTLGVLVLLKLLPRIDPRRSNYAESATAYDVVVLAIVVFMALLNAAILATVFGLNVNIFAVIAILVGILFVAVGAVLDQLRPNWFVGIRTPWTLSSERAWVATHRAGRPVFIAMGVLLVLAGLVQRPWALYAAISICVVGAVGLIAYSFVAWRQDRGQLS
jgi:uncharacterized membrane protein